MNLKRHRGILVLLFVFGVLLGVYGGNGDLWWDSSVYLGMGKYLYSGGEHGLYEASRPVVWPLLLGLFWKMGLDPVLWGRLLLAALSLGCVGLTYVLGARFFSRKVGLVGAGLLALSSTYLLFSTVLHSEVPALFFLLTGVYLLVEGRFAFAGFLLGIAVMTRFFQLFVVLGCLGYLVFLQKRTSFKQVALYCLGFLVPVVAFLVFSFFAHGSFFYPFVLQVWMTQNTGWIFHQPLSFYALGLLRENVLVLLGLVGLVVAYRQKKELFLVLFLFSFVPYLLVAHKEMRFLVGTLPFLYLLAARGGYGVLEYFPRWKNGMVGLVILVAVLQLAPQLEGNSYVDGLDEFRAYVAVVEGDDQIWISNPGFLVESDHTALLMYYPLYSSERIAVLREQLGDADHVLFSSCDVFPCRGCEEAHAGFIEILEKRFEKKYSRYESGCEQAIYRATA